LSDKGYGAESFEFEKIAIIYACNYEIELKENETILKLKIGEKSTSGDIDGIIGLLNEYYRLQMNPFDFVKSNPLGSECSAIFEEIYAK
jgi:hypothetical protein